MLHAPEPPSPAALHIVRIPGEQGTIVRCAGALTVATVEALRRELDLQISLGHPALILNLSGCRAIDVDGVLLLLESHHRLRKAGRRLVLVIADDAAALALETLGLDWVVPAFPTEKAAAWALRSGLPEPAPEILHSLREASLAMWRGVHEALAEGCAEELARRVTSWQGLCRQTALPAGRRTGDYARCSSCALFHVLGARAEDLRCESVTLPMLNALLSRDRGAAQSLVVRLIKLIENVPLPEE